MQKPHSQTTKMLLKLRIVNSKFEPWKVFLEISKNSQENTCVRVSFLIKLEVEVGAYNFINKETLAQAFSCEFCKISRNTLFTEHLWAIVSVEHLLTAASAFLETVL